MSDTKFKKGDRPWNKGRHDYKNNKISHGFIDSHGYMVFYNKGQEIKAHRVIWEQYHGKIPKGYIIHHKDENKLNNDISNLQLVTRAQHSKIHNLVEKMRKGNIKCELL